MYYSILNSLPSAPTGSRVPIDHMSNTHMPIVIERGEPLPGDWLETVVDLGTVFVPRQLKHMDNILLGKLILSSTVRHSIYHLFTQVTTHNSQISSKMKSCISISFSQSSPSFRSVTLSNFPSAHEFSMAQCNSTENPLIPTTVSPLRDVMRGRLPGS